MYRTFAGQRRVIADAVDYWTILAEKPKLPIRTVTLDNGTKFPVREKLSWWCKQNRFGKTDGVLISPEALIGERLFIGRVGRLYYLLKFTACLP